METQATTRREGRSEDPPNNPLKMFMLVPVLVLGVVLIVFGATGAGSWALVTGLIVVVASAPSIYVTARGRNPRWNRAAFDRPGDPSKAAVADALRARRNRR
jgi:hypothetical protein